MRILMSGMSTRTVGSPRLRLNYLNFNPLLKLALEEMGHVVDQRRITYGESLDDYDAAFLHVNPLDKLVCQNVPEVCWALNKLDKKAVIFLEDWVSCELRQSWESRLAHYDAWLRWKGYQDLEPHVKAFMRLVLLDVLNSDRWPVIANFYGWGLADEFFSKNFKTPRTLIIDPSPMAQVPEFVNKGQVEGKNRIWVLGALQKHDQWLGRRKFTWPLETYGNARQGHPALQENELVQRYADCWGVLAPRYPVVGWFRPRFLLAVATGSVLYCDPMEGRELGGTYTVPLPEIENASSEGLNLLAQRQAVAFNAACWDKKRLFFTLNFLLQNLTTPKAV